MTEIEAAPKGKGANASFCIPRKAIAALLDAKADNVTIGAYLTLARFTDVSGQYSPASVSALRQYIGLNQHRAKKAIARLTSIMFTEGKGKAATSTPLVYTREQWEQTHPGATLPDGPVERSRILHVLPDFGEPLEDRIWFSTNLVSGFGMFKLPLKRLKDAGTVAGRLLLSMYQAADMTTYGGIPPHSGPWMRYETTGTVDKGPARIIHAKRKGQVARFAEKDTQDHFKALLGLEGSGFFYEVVLVMNRDPQKNKFPSGEEFGDVPADAEPLYELDARSFHGYKPAGEIGLAGLTAKTSGQLGHSVAEGQLINDFGHEIEKDHQAGEFTGKYAAIVPRGYGAMIVGIYRPRFRVANPKNAGVKDAWIRIYESNRQGLEWINGLRKAAGLEEAVMPAKPAPTGPEIGDGEGNNEASSTLQSPQ